MGEAFLAGVPPVTVIVAVYNGAATIERCIQSVAGQSIAGCELIIMDGGSSDGTREILEANNDKISYWESSPDRGIYHAWNKALDHAHGEWVCFLGADDYFISNESLAMLLRHAADPDLDLICSRILLVNERGDRLGTVGKPWNWKELKRRQGLAHPGMLHRRSLFKKFGRFEEKYRIAGDYEFLLRLGPDAKVKFLDQATVCMGNSGISHTHVSLVFKEVKDIQSAHPEIGILWAYFNYALSFLKTYIKKILCAFYFWR